MGILSSEEVLPIEGVLPIVGILPSEGILLTKGILSIVGILSSGGVLSIGAYEPNVGLQAKSDPTGRMWSYKTNVGLQAEWGILSSRGLQPSMVLMTCLTGLLKTIHVMCRVE